MSASRVVYMIAQRLIGDGVPVGKVASAMLSCSVALVVEAGQGDAFMTLAKESYDTLRPELEKLIAAKEAAS